MKYLSRNRLYFSIAGYVLIVWALVFMLVGCGTWKTNAVKGYQAGAGVLTETYQSTEKLCVSGDLSKEKCSTFHKMYKRAYEAYIQLGDALKLAIQASDNYETAVQELGGVK